jgi:hypothetical protein
VASTYVNNLRLEEMTTGEKSGTWGNITNTNLQLVGQALGYGTRAIANASTDNITIADGASDADRSMYLKLTGGGQACTVTLLPNTSSKMWIMENATSYTLTFTQGSGANVAIPAGQTKMIFADGLGAGAVVYELGTIAVQNIQADGTVTVGIDDTGYDVTFFGATTGKKLFWDESADTLNVAGTTALDGSLSVTGVTSNADGSAAAPSITNTGDTNTGIFFPAADTVGVAVGGTEVWRYGSNPTTAKNLIINGAMAVAQRGGTVSVASAAGPTYTAVDQFLINNDTGAQAFDTTQDATVLTGVGKSLKVDVTTADASVAAGDFAVVEQRIEAQNLVHLLYGTASAKKLTLSFDVRSPKSGTHCVGLYCDDGARSITKEYTIASADTMERVSVTFDGDTGGTINFDTGIGMRVQWPLIAGSNFQQTADAWAAGQKPATSNQQNLCDNTANNFYISNVQLEVGSVATDFEHEDIGTTQLKCYRYLRQLGTLGSGNPGLFAGYNYSTTGTEFAVLLEPEMRADPTVVVGSVTGFIVRKADQGSAVTTAVAFAALNLHGAILSTTVASGLIQGNGTIVFANTSGGSLLFSAEL